MHAPVIRIVVAIEGRVENLGVYKTVEKALAGRVGSSITYFGS